MLSSHQPLKYAVTAVAVIAAMMLASAAAQAAIINVPGDEPTIQAGIDAANPGDEVVVAQGEYSETINFNGKAITVRSTDPNDAGVVLSTIINGTGFFHVVRCVSGEGPDTVLSGFVITGGRANGRFPDTSGGGMLNDFSSNPTVTNCSFSGNSASITGGGMYNAHLASPTVTNCSFSGNSASIGGGMSNDISSSPTVTRCSFSRNTATNGGGGGMVNAGGNPTVTNCSFTGNTATSSGGGGMFNLSSSPTVANCSFSGNTATNGGGGGMLNLGNSSPTVSNTGFCDNTPDQIDGTFTDGGGNSLLYCPPPIPHPDPCPTDINGDGVTNVLDLIDLLLAFGAACP